jgi:hypothetical protein
MHHYFISDEEQQAIEGQPLHHEEHEEGHQ